MKKTFILFLIIVFSLCAFAACSSEQKPLPSGTPTPSPSVSPEPTTEETGDPLLLKTKADWDASSEEEKMEIAKSLLLYIDSGMAGLEENELNEQIANMKSTLEALFASPSYSELRDEEITLKQRWEEFSSSN